MSDKLVAIDLSLSSTGMVCLNRDNTIYDFALIETNTADFKDEPEKMLLDIEFRIMGKIREWHDGYHVRAIAMEGLSFAANTSSGDLIAGNFWGIRKAIKQSYYIPLGIIPVTSWRSTVLNGGKAETVILKNEYGKLWSKWGCVNKLSNDVRERFDDYISINDLMRTYNDKGKRVNKKAEKNPLFDLTDAYWLGVYRNSLG